MNGGEFFAVLDGMRGMAAVLVAVRHLDALIEPIGFAESFLAVDLFFVLSGAVLCHAYEGRLRAGMGAGRFLWARLVRVYPLYLLGSMLGLIAAAADGVDAGVLLRQGVFAALMLPDLRGAALFPLNDPAWSLLLELFANAVYVLVLRVAPRFGPAVLVAASFPLLAWAALSAVPPGLDLGWKPGSVLAGLPRVVFSFFAGVLLYRLRRDREWVLARSGLVPLLLAVLMLVLRPDEALRPWYELLAVGLVFPACVGGALLCRPRGRFVAWCAAAGAVSYPLYAVHAPLAHLVGSVLGGAGGAPWLGLGLLGLLLPGCLLLNSLVDVPLRQLLLRRREARPAAG